MVLLQRAVRLDFVGQLTTLAIFLFRAVTRPIARRFHGIALAIELLLLDVEILELLVQRGDMAVIFL
ncbi:MAG: hypothetical protein ACREOJ_03710 [Gemmatimonadaceae bacterium]